MGTSFDEHSIMSFKNMILKGISLFERLSAATAVLAWYFSVDEAVLLDVVLQSNLADLHSIIIT